MPIVKGYEVTSNMNRPNNKPIMATHLPLPDRELFEREIHDLFHNGDLSAIARYLHKDQAAVSKALNPFDEGRVNPIYECLRYLWAFDCVRESLGDGAMSLITLNREKWLPDCEVFDAPAQLTENVGKQYAEAIHAELEHADIDKQIKEYGDVRDAVQDKLDSLISQRSESFGVRRWAKEVVNGRR